MRENGTHTRTEGHVARAAALVAAAMLLIATGPAAAGPTAAQKCEGGKNQTSGKYAACAAKAEKGLVLKSDVDKYGAALIKCATKIGDGFMKLEAKGDCPTSGDAGAVQDFLDGCTQAVAQALADGTPFPDLGACATCSGDLATCGDDLTTCDGALTTCDGALTACGGDLTMCEEDLAACVASPGGLPTTGQTTAYGAGSDGNLQKGAARSFTDNGDGTFTDNVTGLMWEKKSDDGSIHDKDNTYTWNTGGAPHHMNGTMATTFLADLNSGGGFAGYTDWRIPIVYELQSLANFEVPHPGPTVFPEFNNSCTGGCTVTTCSCTRSDIHWSSTTVQGFPGFAWFVTFDYGAASFSLAKTNNTFVRAVRAGS
jgi:hypothetical protein